MREISVYDLFVRIKPKRKGLRYLCNLYKELKTDSLGTNMYRFNRIINKLEQKNISVYGAVGFATLYKVDIIVALQSVLADAMCETYDLGADADFNSLFETIQNNTFKG